MDAVLSSKPAPDVSSDPGGSHDSLSVLFKESVEVRYYSPECSLPEVFSFRFCAEFIHDFEEVLRMDLGIELPRQVTNYGTLDSGCAGPEEIFQQSGKRFWFLCDLGRRYLGLSFQHLEEERGC